MIASLLLAAAAAAPQGRLVVLVVVDQLRYQDVLWLSPELGPKGFAGLGRAAPMRYETAVTETAPGHATLATGTYAEVHGIVGNRFPMGAREPAPGDLEEHQLVNLRHIQHHAAQLADRLRTARDHGVRWVGGSRPPG